MGYAKPHRPISHRACVYMIDLGCVLGERAPLCDRTRLIQHTASHKLRCEICVSKFVASTVVELLALRRFVDQHFRPDAQDALKSS